MHIIKTKCFMGKDMLTKQSFTNSNLSIRTKPHTYPSDIYIQKGKLTRFGNMLTYS